MIESVVERVIIIDMIGMQKSTPVAVRLVIVMGALLDIWINVRNGAGNRRRITMPERVKFERKFRVKHDVLDGRYHWGIFFCIDWEDCNGNRDKYLLLCFGKHDLSIGIMSEYKEEE